MLFKNLIVKKKKNNKRGNDERRETMESAIIKGTSHPMSFARAHAWPEQGRGNTFYFPLSERDRASESSRLMSVCIFTPHHPASLEDHCPPSSQIFYIRTQRTYQMQKENILMNTILNMWNYY